MGGVREMLRIGFLILILLDTITGALGAFFLKKGSKKFNFNVFEQIKNLNLIFGVFIFGISFLLNLYILSLERLSVVYAFSSLTYLWVLVLSLCLLKEKMNWKKWLGTILVLTGVFLMIMFS